MGCVNDSVAHEGIVLLSSIIGSQPPQADPSNDRSECQWILDFTRMSGTHVVSSPPVMSTDPSLAQESALTHPVCPVVSLPRTLTRSNLPLEYEVDKRSCFQLRDRVQVGGNVVRVVSKRLRRMLLVERTTQDSYTDIYEQKGRMELKAFEVER